MPVLNNFNPDVFAKNYKGYIGSHNSFTYLPVRKWYMKVLSFAYACQSQSITNQYNMGVRVFDLRISMEGDTPIICNGLCEYVGDPVKLLHTINFDNVCVRVINERNKDLESYKKYVFEKLVSSCNNIKFLVIGNRKDMNIITDDRYTNVLKSYPSNTNYFCYWGHSADELNIGHQYSGSIQSPKKFASKYNGAYFYELQSYINNMLLPNSTFWFDYIGEYGLLK